MARALTGRGRWLTLGAAVTVGLVGEWISFGVQRPSDWLPDLTVGWSCIGVGLLTAAKRPDSRIGQLLAGVGFGWFIGNFSGVPFEPLAAVCAQFTLVHRAVLLQAALTVPTGRINGRPQLAAIAIGYIAWSVPATAGSTIATAIAGAPFAALATIDLLKAPRPKRQIAAAGLAGTMMLGVVFVAESAVHLAVPSGSADIGVLLLNEGTIVVVVLGIMVATLYSSLLAGRVTDLMVEASLTRSGIVRNSLAEAIGDPSLQVGYWHGPSHGYLDAAGDQVEPAPRADARDVMRVDLDGRPAAVLIHDPAALESSSLTVAVRTATALAAANARLRSDVLDQLAEVRASRRRLVLAGDRARGRLERQIKQGPMRRAQTLATALLDAHVQAEARAEPATAQISRAREALERATKDLETVAIGLHPASVVEVGLQPSIRALTERSPIPIEVACHLDRLPEPIEIALYYACAEALTNVAKHAGASRASVALASAAAHVVLAIADDGVGGAEPGAGSGLRGISDRIEALGGHLRLTSEAGAGTQLFVEIPLPAPTA